MFIFKFMKTAIHEGLDKIKQNIKDIGKSDPAFVAGLKAAMACFDLKKEKDQISDAYNTGWNDRGNDDGDYAQFESGEDYYNKTYKK